jgi:transglutaminase-like putative cysteine protease
MDYQVRHRTVYRYLQSVSMSCHLAHLLPRATPNQVVHRAELRLSPAPARRERRLDFFGNVAEWLYVEQPHATLEIEAESNVRVLAPKTFDAASQARWESVAEILERTTDAAGRDAIQYAFDSPLTASGKEAVAYAKPSFPADRPLLEAAMELMARIHADFRYDNTVTNVTTPVSRVFQMRAGVCQDFAHVGIACLRALGLPARYVSGYLLTQPPPGQQRLVGADASHAWFSVWAPGFGWVDLDPTNAVRPAEGHVTVAWGRDYSDVAPIGGIVTGGSDHVVEVGVDVVPVQPTP